MLLFAKKKKSCRDVYIGETKGFLKFRLDVHHGYIVNRHLTEAIAEHFNLPGHSLANFSVTALEKVKVINPLYRKEREEYFITQFNIYHNGINKNT